MTEDLKDLLTQISHHEAMADHHTSMVATLRKQYRAAIGDSAVEWGTAPGKRSTKAHSRWVAWLKTNGPARRKTIAEAVGLLTGEVPPYADSLGMSMEQLSLAAYPDDSMLRLSVENEHGHGRPSDVYFLWSQRFDVHPLFGVGPINPAMVHEPKLDEIDGFTDDDLPDENEMLRRANFLNPIKLHDVDISSLDQEIMDELTKPLRYATVDEWKEQWGPSLLSIAQTGMKPSEEVKQAMLDSLPPDADGPSTLAIAFSQAVQQSGGPLLGVVQPPEEDETEG